jgi:hypothetical protein
MSRVRLVFVHAVILTIIGGSMYDIVTRQEHWPFSNYPMFSTVHRERVLTWPRLYGVTADGRELPLVRHDELFPLDQSRLPLGLRRIHQETGAGPRLHAALADVLRRYEVRRAAGEHRGPELAGVRLYTVRWPLMPHAANLANPRWREQLLEVRRSAMEAR